MSFKYVDTVTINATSGNLIGYHTFSANGLYDPDITGVGHQPRGFDQYMQFYQHYTVIGSKIRATFMPQASTGSGTMYVGIMKTPTATPGLTAINDVIEMKDRNTKIGNGYLVKPTTVNMGCSLSKYFGQKVLQEDNNAGTDTSNPTEQAYFQVFCATNNVGVTDPVTTQILIEIEFIAVLHEPKLISGS